MKKSLFKDGEQGTLVCPSNIQRMITGATSVFYVRPRFRANYEDGSHEEYIIEDMPLDADYFGMINKIQSMREKV